MGLFKRRARTAPEVVEPTPVAHEVDLSTESDEITASDRANDLSTEADEITASDRAAELQEEIAEEKQEYDVEVEAGRGPRRGLNPHWGLSRGDAEVSRREARAVADPESDTAETLFIQSEREAEERGRYGLDN
jgi:hypothetical protein